MLHEPAPKETGVDHASARKTRIGVILFLIYTFIYFGFVIIGIFFPDIMGINVLGGQNIAVIYGFGLILLAIAMGFVYNLVCSRYEDEMNGGEQP